ncbi:sialidase family protein [Rhizobium sp. SL42]|uniref:sialidase family protein n=1 Tax=Rhizobium sp. SL42 TaxID=2806346 RepID=UPI001F2B39E7|nr:exo-alpha-sialidase [Rhizobium sp. SL42]UJW77438.1 exo-alpha-sialidase [Rhizobium sp. SL42]
MSALNQPTELAPEDVPARMTGLLTAHPHHEGWQEAFLVSPTVQNHAANLAFLADGTLICVWFGGTMEGMGDISIYMSRLAPGSTAWSVPEKMTEDATKSEQNPIVFNAPDGKIWLIYTSQVSGNQDGAVVKCRISSDGGKHFGEPRILCDLPGTFVRQPVIVNAAGDWLLPVFLCRSLPGQRWTGDADTAGVLVSEDDGKSWSLTEVPDSYGAVHMNIVPRGDGRMTAFFRNRYAGQVLHSWSDDDGRNWSPPQPTVLPNNNSSIQAVDLKNGAIAIVYNHSNAASSDQRRLSLYDEIEGEAGEEAVGEQAEPATGGAYDGPRAVWGVPRAPLSLAFSYDDGVSFLEHVDLDTGDGYCLSNNSQQSLNREFSYPSVVEGPDGTLHVAYTYFRRAIKYVRIPSGKET